jgi:hypothetical protein
VTVVAPDAALAKYQTLISPENPALTNSAASAFAHDPLTLSLTAVVVRWVAALQLTAAIKRDPAVTDEVYATAPVSPFAGCPELACARPMATA